ncbi:MAG: trimethylamine methyltransferase family protein [Actinobacteria bacterium]|nr:trimethylamine methyltransferase family protein [Actinomycetota bacterium]
MQKGFTRNFEPLRILRENQVEQIHKASLNVLEETGFLFDSVKALKLLEENGCKVDYNTKIAKIPSTLVEDCIRRTPSCFHVRARDPKMSIMFGANTTYFFNSAGARYTDIDTGEVTMPTLEQNNNGVLISDALSSVHAFPSYTPYFEIEGVPPAMSCPVSCASRHRFSGKPSRGAQPTYTYIWETKIAQAVGAQLLGCVEGAAPLSLCEDAIEAAYVYLDAGFPIYIASGSIMGGSHPITVAGASVSHNAELLAIIVLLQCIKPGCGIIANNFVSSMNMATGDLSFGTAAIALHQMAYNQIWHDLYKIPINNTGSAFSNSKVVDYQLGAEKLPLAMCSALSGANLIVLHGGVTAELAYNPILAIIDDDIANTIGRIIESFDVNNITIGLDTIMDVGVSPGTFLNTKQTRTYWKTENYITKVFDKLSYKEWVEGGKKTVIKKAKERYDEILATHKPYPLAEDQDKAITNILKEAEEFYKKKGLI